MPSNIGSECTISSWWTSHFLPPYGFFTIQVCLLLLHNLEPESYGFIYWDRFTGATISYSPSTILTTMLIECLASGLHWHTAKPLHTFFMPCVCPPLQSHKLAWHYSTVPVQTSSISILRAIPDSLANWIRGSSASPRSQVEASQSCRCHTYQSRDSAITHLWWCSSGSR